MNVSDTPSTLPLIYSWPSALIEGRFIRRYERFVAEVQVGNDIVKAHCVNPGRMEGLVIAGAKVWLSTSLRSSRALAQTWELVELEGRLVGTNTSLPNTLVYELLRQKLLPSLANVTNITPEQAFGHGHRADFRLEHDNVTHWLEVKNCHLVYPDGIGYFPDSASERAVAHVKALEREVKRGSRATLIFTVQRNDARAVRPSALHCLEFAVALRKAAKAGVSVRAVELIPSLNGIHFARELPVDLAPYEAQKLRPWCSAYDATSGWVRKNGKWSGQSIA